MGVRNACDGPLLLFEQFSLCETCLADDQLAGKHPALLYSNGSCGNIAFQCAFSLDHDHLSGDLPRHPAFDLDAFSLHSAKAVNVGLAIDNDVARADLAWNFSRVIDRRGIIAMQIAAQPAFY